MDNEHYFLFDFDEATYLVKYKSDKDLGDEIHDAILSLDWGYEMEYEDCVNDVMNSFGVEWEKVPCRVCRI